MKYDVWTQNGGGNARPSHVSTGLLGDEIVGQKVLFIELIKRKRSYSHAEILMKTVLTKQFSIHSP